MNFDLSLVIPTYNEKENIRDLVDQIFTVFKKHNILGEVIIVDDNSPDSTGTIADELAHSHSNITVLHRKEKEGLSSAVLAGFNIAKSNIVGVMDADLSHPPERIPEMFSTIQNNADLVIGSRYVPGGAIKGWGWYRKFQSRVATLLSRVFTNVRDTMTGFFLVRKECLKNVKLNPKGFKILLEIIVKAHCTRITEIPITFTDRTRGKSKAGVLEIFGLISNLYGYLKSKPEVIKTFFRFGIVGVSGLIINLAVLYFLTDRIGIFYLSSAIIAFFSAATSNFILNKTWTFKESLGFAIGRKYVAFFTVSLVALVVNLAVLYSLVEFINLWYILAQAIAIGIAFIANFLGNAIWTFNEPTARYF